MKEIQDLVEAHNTFKTTIPDADAEFKSIASIEQVILWNYDFSNGTGKSFLSCLKSTLSYFKSYIVQEIIHLIEQHGFERELIKNPYTDLTGGDIHRKWVEVQQAVPKRDSQLQRELHRQQSQSCFCLLMSRITFKLHYKSRQ